MLRYVIGEAAILIPEDTEVRVDRNVDFDVYVLSNQRLNVELAIYEGPQPDFETDASQAETVLKERIGDFPAWRIVHERPGYCGSEILVEVSRSRALKIPSYLHFFYQSTDFAVCQQAERIVRSLQMK